MKKWTRRGVPRRRFRHVTPTNAAWQLRLQPFGLASESVGDVLLPMRTSGHSLSEQTQVNQPVVGLLNPGAAAWNQATASGIAKVHQEHNALLQLSRRLSVSHTKPPCSCANCWTKKRRGVPALCDDPTKTYAGAYANARIIRQPSFCICFSMA